MTTFVTAFLDLHEDRSKDKSVETYLKYFDLLMSCGIQIHLFVSKIYTPYFLEYPRLRITVIEYDDLNMYRFAPGSKQRLPDERTVYHDTERFLGLMNSKTEFIRRSIELNPFGSEQYAWIDFGIFHVLREVDQSKAFLTMLGSTLLKPGVYVPGYWDAGFPSFSWVCWRFCGGFFIGDRLSLLEFDSYHQRLFPVLLESVGVLTWEVNMWAAYEANGWNPIWYKADHNDSMIVPPKRYFKVVASLTTIPPRIESECRLAIDSLLDQVDEVYLSVSEHYHRFGHCVIPAYLQEEPYLSKVKICVGPDHGPASKYIGTSVPTNTWVFVCDDDQEYKAIVPSMLECVKEIAVYQNHYESIKTKTSGGMVHGYVGNLVHSSILTKLQQFPLPECARFVDDQWMSMFCQIHRIPVLPTSVETYDEIFKVLHNNHEKLGSYSLSSLNNRDTKIQELESFFGQRLP